VTVVGVDGQTQSLPVPHTSSEIEQLRIRRRELTDQLTSAAARRRALSEEIRSAPDGASRTGLEARLRVLDQRIIQLESDVAATGRQIAAAPAELMVSMESESSRTQGTDDWNEGLAFGVFFTLLGVAIVYGVRRFRRKRRKQSPSPALNESAQRLERLEHGVEAIAIEVERISEGQRFVTKLFSDAQGKIGVGNRIAQPTPGRSEEA
jgi:hypothetical protein